MNKRAELCCVSWSKYVERWGDLLFLDLMYLYSGVICCRRCSFLDRCICAALIFAIADVFVATIVSAIPWYSLSQMLSLGPMYLQLAFFELVDAFQPAYHVQLHLHLSFSRTWGYFLFKFYICIPRFLWPADAFHQNFASSTCSFYDLQILPIYNGPYSVDTPNRQLGHFLR